MEDAWEYFGGVPAQVVLDNLRAAIAKADYAKKTKLSELDLLEFMLQDEIDRRDHTNLAHRLERAGDRRSGKVTAIQRFGAASRFVANGLLDARTRHAEQIVGPARPRAAGRTLGNERRNLGPRRASRTARSL